MLLRPGRLALPFRGVASLLLLGPPALAGQDQSARTIVVRDSITGRPIPSALLILPGMPAAFTDPEGRLRVAIQPGSRLTVEARQVGYTPKTVAVDRDTVEVSLRPDPVRLPELSAVGAQGNGCPADDPGGSVVRAALANAERVRALELAYPARHQVEHMTIRVPAKGPGRVVRRDTVTERTRDRPTYAPGAVLGMGRVTDPFQFISVADLAGQAFRESHCFRYAGVDSSGGTELIRVRFQPIAGMTSADWTGTLAVDPISGLLVRAEVAMANIPATSTVESATCEVTFGSLGPGLLYQKLLICETRNRQGPYARVVDGRQVLKVEFERRIPGS